MAKKIKKREKMEKKKKGKFLLDKEKITELKNKSGLKKIAEKVEKENRENINDENFTEFLEPPVGGSAPVLEKVASADTRSLEQELATVRALDSKEKKENIGTDYAANRTNYISISDEDVTRQRERNESRHNETSPDYNTMFQEDKEREKTKIIMGKGDIPQGNAERGNRFEMERQAFVERDKDIKKYVNEGDYK